METEVLLHIDESLDDETRQKLIDTLREECGGARPHLNSKRPHEIFVTYDDKKVALHDIPVIARKHGVHVEIVC
ncbi:MAG: hypothetical protein OEW75_04965 [Cyclobacteriaceae bacterium]|nr:hypothetical protein [Cyclobacteriaceae bacterium]